jgi:outer membrane protein assembly factor BamD
MRRLLALALLLLFTLPGCGKKVQTASTSNLVERDRELYENAMRAINKSRFTEARLLLQTLLETYENSEYSAQAKYAVAESFYREAGHSNLLSSESEFRKFITFFPDHELADDAQMMVAMTHVRQLQKPDRDNTEARLAELELLELINNPNYSSSPLLDEAKEKLRGVQEILAESIFGPARHYYLRRAYPAVIDRCQEILTKYPDFSGTDRVLYLMGEVYRKSTVPGESAKYYAQIVRDYPLSGLVKDSRKHLTALQAAIPEPNPIALERAQQRANDGGKGALGWISLGLLKGGGASVSKDTNAASVRNPTSELSIGGPQE